MKHQDDAQDVLYTSGPIMAGAAVRALNPGGIAREGILQGYRGGFAQVLWVDLAFTPARYHEGSFVEVTELDRPQRYDQCDETCTTDCGHCKGNHEARYEVSALG